MSELDDEVRAANIGTSESLAAHMARQPEHQGCEACSYTDGGCSQCNPRPAIERLAEDDAYEDSLTEGADE